MFVFRRRFLSLLFTLFFVLKICTNTAAQCNVSFPYTEDFETSNGGWTPGGAASDWTWGTPSKQIISAAGSGVKCWITGTLTGNSYNDNESSWLQSPCFDFTNIQLPYLSFEVNFDTESGYDGGALQYSIDGGNTWQSAGDYNDPNDCLNQNWFNANNIRYGVQSSGWSGSSSVLVAGGWIAATHTFPQLAGQKSVIFRFVFGAGKIQNNYNGFAIDNIYLGEAPLDGLVSFVYNCNDNYRVTFNPFPNGCVSAQRWNFGDPSSGVNNTADGSVSADHTFSAAATYQVTLSGVSNNTPVSYTLPVTVTNIATTLSSPILCSGATGTVEAKLTNGDATNAQFYWNTQPELNIPTATLLAGYYTIMATMRNGCVNSSTITLTEPSPLQHTLQTTQPDCSNSNGSIAINEMGGVAPYQYNWAPNAANSSAAAGLAAGTYNIIITDKNACTDNISIPLTQLPSTLSHTIAASLPDCGVSNGSIEITEAGGSGNYTYQWTPNASTNNEANSLQAASYTIVVGDDKGCKDTAAIALQSKPLTFSLGNDTVVCKGQTLALQPNGVFTTYRWNDGSTLPQKQVSTGGNYILQVTNAGGCTASDTVHVSTGCGDLVFPSGFTPNGDGKNELYGPTGGFSLVKNYRLLVYNRYGSKVFETDNPYQRWNGLMNNGQKLSGTYVYIATYLYDGAQKVKKGTITLIL